MCRLTLLQNSILAKLDPESHRELERHILYVTNALYARIGNKKILLSEADRIRLVRWRVWALRLQVGVGAIIDLAFAWAKEVIPPRRHRKVHVLPAPISQLTGKAVYQYVLERVVEDFPGERPGVEHLKSRMLSAVIDYKVPMAKSPKSYMSMDDFAKAYEHSIRERAKSVTEAQHKLSQTLPFRGNPFEGRILGK